MAEERMRAAVLDEPNVRAVLGRVSRRHPGIHRPERSLTMPEPRLDRSCRWRRTRRRSCPRRRTISTRSRLRARRGGGLVKIRATAKGRILGVSIDDSLLRPARKTMLEDLIAAALNDARAKADAAAGGRDAEDERRPAAAAGIQAALLTGHRAFANSRSLRAQKLEPLVCSTFRGQSGMAREEE